MNEKELQRDNNISIHVPLMIFNDMLYSKTFVNETDSIYDKELQGKAMIAGKNVTLLRIKPQLKLREVVIRSNNGRPKLYGKAWFHFSSTGDADNREDHTDENDIANAKDKIDVEADVDISIDPNKGKIQVNPKYAVFEAKIRSGDGGDNEPEPFCQLSIPLLLEKLRVEIPLGVSKFSVPFAAPIKRTFTNSGSDFSIPGAIEKGSNSIVFKCPVELVEEEK